MSFLVSHFVAGGAGGGGRRVLSESPVLVSIASPVVAEAATPAATPAAPGAPVAPVVVAEAAAAPEVAAVSMVAEAPGAPVAAVSEVRPISSAFLLASVSAFINAVYFKISARVALICVIMSPTVCWCDCMIFKDSVIDGLEKLVAFTTFWRASATFRFAAFS